MHCSLTVLALIFLYGGHCFSVWLPSKVTHGFPHRVRLPASRNNAPQHINMHNSCLMVFPVCFNGESTKQVLGFLVMVYGDDLKGV